MSKVSSLSQHKCEPCEGTTQPLSSTEVEEFLRNVPGWQIDEQAKMISRTYFMKDFVTAVNCVNQIAKIAASENHHPDIHLEGYRRLRIDLSTHAIGGLSKNDFIVAAKINEIPVELKE